MADAFTPVRPTRACIEQDLGLRIPDIEVTLSSLDHELIKEAQRIPELYEASGLERIQSLRDRVWFKVKSGQWRGAATRLTEQDQLAGSPIPVSAAPWWLGAAGLRRDGDGSDFYTSLEAKATRAGKGTGEPKSDGWLPTAWDWTRFKLEAAYAVQLTARTIVRRLVALSLRSGRAYSGEWLRCTITALVRADNGGEAYLLIGVDRVADHRLMAVMLDAIPGVPKDSWQPEPGGVAGLTPAPGEVIWSTILPPEVGAQLLDEFDEEAD